MEDATALVVGAHRRIIAPVATRATTDEQLLDSWVQSLGSAHTRRNFEVTARRFLAALQAPLRAASVEHVREALVRVTEGLGDATARQYVLRVKSLLSYARTLGYTQFNAGATIKVRSDAGSRGARLATRIISELEVRALIRAGRSQRDRALLAVAYAGGLRVSELVALVWKDVIPREAGRVQLSVLGKGGRLRQVLLPEVVSQALLTLRGDAGDTDPVFRSREKHERRPRRHGNQVPRVPRLTARAVDAIVKAAAKRAEINRPLSPHWLRHAHASHALDHDATLAEVQETLGHGNIATTSGYLHARPGHSSGLRLDPGIFPSH